MFGVYSKPIEIVWWEHLSFYLSHYPIRVMNPSIGASGKWKYLLLPKLWCVKLLSDPYNPGTVRKILMPNTGTISKDSMSTPIWKPELLMPNQLARSCQLVR